MDKKDYIITLDDNKEYALVDTITYEGVNYVYLIELNNHENCFFAEVRGDTIIDIEDKELLKEVISVFTEKEENNGEKNS